MIIIIIAVIGIIFGFLIKLFLDKSLVIKINEERESIQKKIDEQILIEKTEHQREKESWNIERLQLQRDKIDFLDKYKKSQNELIATKLQLEDAKSGFESTLTALKVSNIYNQIDQNIRIKLQQLDRSISADGQVSELTLSLIKQITEDINSKKLFFENSK